MSLLNAPLPPPGWLENKKIITIQIDAGNQRKTVFNWGFIPECTQQARERFVHAPFPTSLLV
jgi:hypothetical protein